MKEKFYNIPIEKQNIIINACLAEFSINGYNKTSMNDIAKSAGISKASLFYYFDTKKDLYLYLYEFCYENYLRELEKMINYKNKDFFDLFLEHQHKRIKLMKRHPEMFLFINKFESIETEDLSKQVDISKLLHRHPELFTLTNGFNSNDNEELNDDLKQLRKDFVNNLIDSIIKNSDMSKFKENVDINILLDIMKWVINGYMQRLITNNFMDVELDEYILFFKKHLYK